MASLFVVATPLQMLTAQQIIRQENIQDAVLLESYFSLHPEFLDSYDVCRIDKYWKKILNPVCDFYSWDNGGVNLLSTAIPTWKRYCKIKQMLIDNSIDTIYLADYQNQTYRFMTFLFAKQGFKVNYYEEGYSHYVPRFCNLHDSWVWKLKDALLDFIYYIPVYHIRFASWRSQPNRPYRGMPINKRYSIVPGFLNESYDYRLYCKPMMSDRLNELLSDSIEKTLSNKKIYLLLSDPMSEVLYSEYKYLYFDVIKETVKQFTDDDILYIKFHPREPKESIDKTIEILQKLGVRYHVLDFKVNIPVEYLLLNTHFEEIFVFNTSTFFYNGYLFPRCKFTQLLPSLLQKCLQAKAPNENIIQIRLLIDRMNAIS